MTTKKKKTVTQTATKKKTSRKRSTTAKKSDGAENRTSQRVPIQLLVDYRADGSFLFDFCRDLGTGGIFIETKEPLPLGSSVNLTFTIPDSKETLRADGEVIWVQDRVEGRKDLTPGMGVQFSQFGKDERQVLEKFIERYNPERRTTGQGPDQEAS